jgi:hypothetical protein
MRLQRRGAPSNGWRRIGFRNTAEGVVAGLGAAIALGAMQWFSLASHAR